MIITKSISRFARNTLDCLNYVRELKDLGIGIIFEKENINTLDAKGEVLLTILSSLAQDESRSISENCTWGIRTRFETGKHKMSTKRFLGYDTDETGKLVINRTQEPIVVRLYQEFMDGKTTDYIKRIFERKGVKNWDCGTKWQSTTLISMLENEKYKGDALLQKSYTVDFMEQWTEQLQSENLLEGYRAEKFIEYTDGAEPLTDMDTDFMLKTLDHIKVFEDGTLLVVFLDGTEIECKNEEE